MVRKPFSLAILEHARTKPYPTTSTSPREEHINTPASRGGSRLERPVEGVGPGQENLDASDPANGLPSTKKAIIANDLPASLKVGGIDQGRNITYSNENLPLAFEAGSAEATPRTSSESQISNASTKRRISGNLEDLNRTEKQKSGAISTGNPFRRILDEEETALNRHNYGNESSADVWVDDTKLGTRQAFTEPWMQFESSPVTPAAPVWDGGLHHTNICTTAGPSTNHPSLPDKSASSLHKNQTLDDQASKAPEVDVRSHGVPPYSSQPLQSVEQRPPPSYEGFDEGSNQTSNPIHHEVVESSYKVDLAPELPTPPKQGEAGEPPLQPPRPPKEADIRLLASPVHGLQKRQGDLARPKEIGETYQIRLVNWYDASAPSNPRRSPIMVQNANGPCPLLALVNALILTTPADTVTALVETLRVREQVSLGLLLDAVIDELMSGRRRSAAGDLPDVSDLYAFLVTLHTGMNVNPRFVPAKEAPVNLMDAPNDRLTNLHEFRKAGGFEDTREMRLYSTFSIPLIHGWIPPRNHPSFAALNRTAETYEDAQNLMFREEELEEKLKQQGLSPDEQVILEDIASVKFFLSSTATQLTGYGLDTVTETMAPGSVAILFRNDHFSTLYRHPRSGQLLTLVTDMGYAGHDEVVWESLVDLSGEGCEFFAGDFRPVGNVAGDTQRQAAINTSEDDSGSMTVDLQSRREPQSSRSNSNLLSLSTLNINDSLNPAFRNTEQEDHDLALAMQLQEEEEERHRQEAAARRREDELSQTYLNSSDSQGRRTFPGFGRGAASSSGPSPPPRGRGVTGLRRAEPGSAGQGSARQMPKKPFDDEDVPPPTYEQAAKGPAYLPPENHPAHPHSSHSPTSASRPKTQSMTRPRQSSSAFIHHATSYGGSPPCGPGRRGQLPTSSVGSGGIGGVEVAPGMVRRRGGAPRSAVSLEDDRKEKDCIVM